MGAFLVGPILLIGGSWLRSATPIERPGESVLFLTGVAVMSYLVLGRATTAGPELNYLLFPLFVWSALRLGQLPTAAGLIRLRRSDSWNQVRVPSSFRGGLQRSPADFSIVRWRISRRFFNAGAVVCERRRITKQRERCWKVNRQLARRRSGMPNSTTILSQRYLP